MNSKFSTQNNKLYFNNKLTSDLTITKSSE